MQIVHSGPPCETHPAAIPAGMYLEELGRESLTYLYDLIEQSVPDSEAALYAKEVLVKTLRKVLDKQPVTHLEVLGLAWMVCDINKFLIKDSH